MINNMLLPGQEATGAVDQLFWNFSWLSTWHLNNLPLFMLSFNLVLLLVPYLAILGLENIKKIKKLNWLNYLELIGLGFIFFIFFPNTAYLTLDFRHLSGFCPPSPYLACTEGVWMLPVFFLIGLIGVSSFVYLLQRLEKLLIAWWGKVVATWLIIIYLPLVSLGVMLGLVERWNSWQIFLTPFKIIQSALIYCSWGWRLLDWLIFTAFLFVIYYLGRLLTFRGFRGKKKHH